MNQESRQHRSFPTLILLSLLAGFAATSLHGVSPQDSGYAPIKEIPISYIVEGGFIPVLKNDLVYYSFVDGTNQIRSIRVRDLDGVLVHEIHMPAYTGYSVHRMVVADNGTIYAYQKSPTSRSRIHIYTLSGGSYSETGVFGPDGTPDTDFHSSAFFYGRLDVSPVSGNLFVQSYARFSTTYPDGSKVQVFDPNGVFLYDFETNGILAPTLEGAVGSIDCVTAHDGSGEVWIRGVYGTHSTLSQWYKVFAEDGTFKRLVDMGSGGTLATIDGDLVYYGSSSNLVWFPTTADSYLETIGFLKYAPPYNFEGRDSKGRLIDVTNTLIKIYEAPVFRTFDPGEDNAIPNPMVSRIVQRAGTTILDIDFEVEDADDPNVSIAAMAFPDGTQNIVSALPITTITDGTETVLGNGKATNTRHRLSWDAGADWNLDFGDIAVMILARDSRTHFFDVHLVEIPADGERPAVTISRNMLEEYDFTMQWLWLMATNDPSITDVDGIIFGVGGSYDTIQLTDAQGKSTSEGRDFLLERDGLRVATSAEVIRAREGATPGFTIILTPPQRIVNAQNRSLPSQINEYGIESRWTTTGTYNYSPTSPSLWHVVPITP